MFVVRTTNVTLLFKDTKFTRNIQHSGSCIVILNLFMSSHNGRIMKVIIFELDYIIQICM
jgi:hypothetical protein